MSWRMEVGSLGVGSCSWIGGPRQQDVWEGRAKKQKSGLEWLAFPYIC